MKPKITPSKLMLIAGVISAITICVGNNLLMSGNLIELPNKTEGVTVSGVLIIGCSILGIFIISVLIGVGVMLIVKKMRGVEVVRVN